jgi:hypothetical protein
MKRIRQTILVFMMILSLLAVENGWSMEGANKPTGKPYAEGELLVKFKEGVSEAQIREVLRQTGTEVSKFLRIVKVYVLKLPPGATVEDMKKKFQTLPEVEYAEPNYTVTIQPSKKE